MSPSFFHIILILLIFLGSFSSFALDLTPANFDEEYARVQEKFNSLDAKLTNPLRKKMRNAEHNPRVHLSSEQIEFKKEYTEIKKDKQLVDSVYALKEELNRMYLRNKNISVDKKKLNHEATVFALEIFYKTGELKKQYRSFFIPVVHNMMIDVGLRKRGACKDWAEDLLNHMIPVERNFFELAWGEANPKKITEHNVLVVYPNYAEFKDGLIVDPWRTSGRVFWLSVVEDKHYKWHPWKAFGTY